MSYERDARGFLVGRRCAHCNGPLVLSPENEARGYPPSCAGYEAALEAYRRAERAMKGASYMVPSDPLERDRQVAWERARRWERLEQRGGP